MTRLWLWICLTLAGLALAFFGLLDAKTASDGALFTAVALALHFLFGEEA